jgi:hypothetical protein
MDGEGFEPSKASLTDLQSAPFGHSGTHPKNYKIKIINFIAMSQADDRTWTDNLLITSQLLCQLSHIGISDTYKIVSMGPIGLEPMTLCL